MKNNTKIKLKLSKHLFESLAKQVLAEGKKGNMSGGAYTEAVKQPKGEKKSEKNEDLNISKNDVPQVRKTNTGASKQQVATTLRQTGTDLARNADANIQSGEGGEFLDIMKKLLDLADDKDNSGPALKRIQTVLSSVNKTRKGDNEINLSKNDVPQVRKFEEMQTNIDEDDTMDFQKGAFDVSEMDNEKLNENTQQVMQDLIQMAQDNGGFLATVIGITGVAKFLADKIAKDPKAKKALDNATGAGSSDLGPFGGKSFGSKK